MGRSGVCQHLLTNNRPNNQTNDSRCTDYWDAAPVGQQRGTVFLIHGYPDISLGWRYQIPMLASLGLRCIALDSMGYSDTVHLLLSSLKPKYS